MAGLLINPHRPPVHGASTEETRSNVSFGWVAATGAALGLCLRRLYFLLRRGARDRHRDDLARDAKHKGGDRNRNRDQLMGGGDLANQALQVLAARREYLTKRRLAKMEEVQQQIIMLEKCIASLDDQIAVLEVQLARMRSDVAVFRKALKDLKERADKQHSRKK
jgi:hypothetical protein